MQWLAESLDKKANETAEDTIRRYLASKFYKDHMQTYKKRPIYWLFSSGKQGLSRRWCTCTAITKVLWHVCVLNTSCH
jgi:hypothetical protein